MPSDRCPATPTCGLYRGLLFGLPIALVMWVALTGGFLWLR
jgi:hypothetical protein